MKVLKLIKEWRTVELPEVNAPTFIDLATAYVCLQCRTIQDSSPRGACGKCSSMNVISVDQLLNWRENPILQLMEEAKQQKAAKEKPSEESVLKASQNLALFLTSPDKRVA